MWKKQEYSCPRGFGYKASHGGKVVLRVWQIVLLNFDLLVRRRSGCDCAVQALEFFSGYERFPMSLRAVIEVVEIVVADAAGVAKMGWWIRKFRRARQS